MRELLQHWMTSAPEAASLCMTGLGVKASILILLAGAVHLVMSNRRPVMRSTLWNAAIVSLMILPVVLVVGPQWHIDCLSLPTSAASTAPSVHTTHIDSSSSQVAGHADVAVPVSFGQASLTPDVTARNHDSDAGLTLASVLVEYRWHLILGIYGAGMVLLGLRLGSGLFGVYLLKRNVRPFTRKDWHDSKDRWCRHLAIEEPVELALSDEVSVPCTIGWRRQLVIIPASLVDLMDDRDRDSVLLHELAHIRRGDYIWQIMLRVTQVLYWMNPLIWVAGWLISRNREQACDDLCAYHEREPGAYQEALLKVVSALVHRPRMGLGIAMASSENLSLRLRRLARRFPSASCLASWQARIAMNVLLVAMAATLASVKLTSEANAHVVAATQAPGSASDAVGVTYQSVEGQIDIEAESFFSRQLGQDGGWYEASGQDGTLINGGWSAAQAPTWAADAQGNYMVMIGSNSAQVGPTEAGYQGPTLQYRVWVETPGDYELAVRWTSRNEFTDSLYAYITDKYGNGLNGGAVDYFMYHAHWDGWRWRSGGLWNTTYCNAQGCPDSAIWTFPSAGEYIITIAGRESEVIVDALSLRPAEAVEEVKLLEESAGGIQRSRGIGLSIQD